MYEPQTTDGPISSLYKKFCHEREPFIDRAEDAARLTIPGAFPKNGHNSWDKLPNPAQSIGARGVNNIGGRLLLSLVPANTPFFKLAIDEYSLLAAGASADEREKVDQELVRMEQAIMSELDTTNVRNGVAEALKSLVITGNALLHIPDTGGSRIFKLNEYVIKRDGVGNTLCIITHEKMSMRSLPDDMREAVAGKLDDNDKKKDSISLYTLIERVDNETFKLMQEVAGIPVPGSEGTVKAVDLPYIPLRFNAVSNESYGRSLVEEYQGDLESLEQLTQTIVRGSAASAKVLFLARPASNIDVREMARAPSGSIIEGDFDEVSCLQVNKHADFSVALSMMEQIRDRLGYAFLLNSSIQRPGERVTATEVRAMIAELEVSLGAVFDTLAVELQLPLVNALMSRMQKEDRLPQLSSGIVRPVVVTGLHALGRGSQTAKLTEFLATAANTLGAESLQMYINVRNAMERLANSTGIQASGLIKSEEEIAAEMQNQQAGMAIQSLGPKALDIAASAAQEQAQ